MARITIVILSLICSLQVLTARTIQGMILSSNDSIAVAGANCRLMSDGKFVSGTTANDRGAFSLETEVKSVLNLEISMTGFSLTNIIIETGGKNLNIGTIYLDEGIALN